MADVLLFILRAYEKKLAELLGDDYVPFVQKTTKVAFQKAKYAEFLMRLNEAVKEYEEGDDVVDEETDEMEWQ